MLLAIMLDKAGSLNWIAGPAASAGPSRAFKFLQTHYLANAMLDVVHGPVLNYSSSFSQLIACNLKSYQTLFRAQVLTTYRREESPT